MKKLGDKAFVVLVAITGLALMLGLLMLHSYFEARAFNNATGSDVSTWDALFIELRVQDGPKR